MNTEVSAGFVLGLLFFISCVCSLYFMLALIAKITYRNDVGAPLLWMTALFTILAVFLGVAFLRLFW